MVEMRHGVVVFVGEARIFCDGLVVVVMAV